MIYFSVYITFNEIIHLKKSLSRDSFCMFQTREGPECYYGIVKEEVYHPFLEAMSAETLQQLEYLSENEFSRLFGTDKKSDHLISWIGNRRLIDPFISFT